MGSSSLNRQIVVVKLGQDLQIEAILVNDLNVFSYNMNLPKEWDKFRADWCDPISDNHNIDAQLLVGSDKAIYHPRDALDKEGRLIETSSARLKVSVLSGKFLAHGHCAAVATELGNTPPPAVITFTGATDLPSSEMEESITTQVAEAMIHNYEDDTESSHSNNDQFTMNMNIERPTNPDEMDIITIVNSEDDIDGFTASIAAQL